MKSVLLVNTGALPMPYIATGSWVFGGVYAPGVAPGGDPALSGVLAPGGVLDITSVYYEGVVALLGSAEPFSLPDAGFISDEGTIPWPAGVAGSGGATTMYVAEIGVPSTPPPSCQVTVKFW